MSERRASLAETHVRVPRRDGLVPLHARGDGGVDLLASWRLRLRAGEDVTLTVAAACEAVWVLQAGTARLTFGRQVESVSRASVFGERASSLYLPPYSTATVHAEADLEAVLIETRLDGAFASAPGAEHPVLVRPDDVAVNERGRGDYVRTVHDILVDDPYARRLLVGETFNPPGRWSSFPPHKHDGRDGEPALEEVYHYRIEPATGFGLQMIYTADGESVTHAVRDGDAVVLPYGYHPVAAPPGHQLYYLWVLAGEARQLSLYEDPDHRWLHDVD